MAQAEGELPANGEGGNVPVPGPKTAFRVDIQRAKGLAIFLVVLGHLVTGTPPVGADWYMSLRTIIYAFHMPFFMALSGYTFYYVNSLDKALPQRSEWIWARAKRLLQPFLLFGLIIVLGKHLAAQVIYVDNYSQSLGRDLLNLVWYTPQSAAKSIWYVFVLFEICVIAVLVAPWIKRPAILFALSLPLVLISDRVPYLYTDRLFLYMPFFFAGGMLAQAGDRFLSWVDRKLLLSLVLFLAAIVLSRYAAVWKFSLYLCGLLSIPAILGLCRLKALDRDRLLLALGNLSFVIYLLNTIFIGLAKGVLYRFVPWDGSGFLVFFVVLLAAGLIGPILMKKLVFSRSAYLDRLTT